MLLPPVTFPAVDGLAVYPAEPALQDKTEGRTDALSATRTDSATYILQKPGDYTLPAIDVRWWNAAERRVETAHLDTMTMQVAANPAVQSASADAPRASIWAALVDLIADHWRLALLAILVSPASSGSRLEPCGGSQPIIAAGGRRICNPRLLRSNDFAKRSGTATPRLHIFPCSIGCRMLARQDRITRSKPSRWLQRTPSWTARSTRSKPSCLRHNAALAVGRDVNCCTALEPPDEDCAPV